jgi:hypothetical protein
VSLRFISRNRYPIVIGGFYRSGTSLVRRILDAHSHIHCPPEIKFFRDFYGDYRNDDLWYARFFSSLRTIGLEDEDLLEIYGHAFIRSHELAAKRLGKRRWGDKNPENLLYLDSWFKLLKKKMFFIFVVRDPFDTIASLLEVGFPRAVPPTFEEKVAFFQAYVEKGLLFAETHPEISYMINYEDLVRKPEGELVALFDFIGEKFEADVLTKFCSEERQKGLEDPKILLEKSIHDKSVGRGRRDLTEEQRDFIIRQCLSVIEKTRYREILPVH